MITLKKSLNDVLANEHWKEDDTIYVQELIGGVEASITITVEKGKCKKYRVTYRSNEIKNRSDEFGHFALSDSIKGIILTELNDKFSYLDSYTVQINGVWVEEYNYRYRPRYVYDWYVFSLYFPETDHLMPIYPGMFTAFAKPERFYSGELANIDIEELKKIITKSNKTKEEYGGFGVVIFNETYSGKEDCDNNYSEIFVFDDNPKVSKYLDKFGNETNTIIKA
ncbi:hypothetical protein JXA27_06800 [Aerococcaceae bacterium zg-B36]|uniref:hypothetical protein n=1 Tax=Aerococcaceae bacterium zg-252 TaxID=2796928 RepID=UPI001BD908B5|nr:hypothetical protein [Aerococcaceae bacterium zg-B36]